MAPRLGAADSFNSSSATIRPDDTQRSRSYGASRVSAGGLGPSDSVGRELDAILGGQVGVLQSENGVRDPAHNPAIHNWLNAYRASTTGNPNPSIPEFDDSSTAESSTAAPLARLPSEFNPLAFLNDPSDGTGGTFFDGLQLDQHLVTTAEQSGVTGSPSITNPNAIAGAQLYRPSSSHSHHSHVSLSSTDKDTDSGFYTTDIDTDQEGGVGPSPGPDPLAEIGGLNLNTAASPYSGGPSPGLPATISPGAEGLGSSRRLSTTKRARSGGITAAADEEQRRIDKLEHRRSINRRSAQKHRLRRKEELETLSRQLAERDTKIAQLEKELAVSRAQLQQLMSLMGSMGTGAGAGAASK